MTEDKKLFSYLRVFLLPTLVLKAAIIYFGLNYSSYPGEGYGWGLLFSVIFSLLNFGYFIFKNWNEPDEDADR